jgi:uncharacterized repeat protein (TIGR03803 family)
MSEPFGSKGPSMFRILGFANKSVLGTAFTLAMLVPPADAEARTFKVLHSFACGTDGGIPLGGLILDAAGDLYGTTAGNSECSFGTVFKLAPDGTETVLYNFPGANGGSAPDSTLVMDKSGKLYGTTFAGGTIGCGVVFKISSTGKESLIHDFAGPPSDGCTPDGALVMDASGDLYGTTEGGGKNRDGAVFKLTSDGVVTLLYSFCRKANCMDGTAPFGGLIADSAGNFYGTTLRGGRQSCNYQCGTVFELTPGGTETVLYGFKGPPNDANTPEGTLMLDHSGNLFGTLYNGGRAGCESNSGCGAAFKLGADRTETVLHFFTGRKGDGGNPFSGLLADGVGNLYGTTQYGGGPGCTVTPYGCGTVFKLAPDGTETVLHSFGKGTQGANPASSLAMDTAGNLYGTASEGGAGGFGTVFKLTP